MERGDAVAIQAAEVRATGRTTIILGGVAAAAQSAATINSRVTQDEDKTRLVDVLAVITVCLLFRPGLENGFPRKQNKQRPTLLTRQIRMRAPSCLGQAGDPLGCRGVTRAVMRNDPHLTTDPARVVASIATAAHLIVAEQLDK